MIAVESGRLAVEPRSAAQRRILVAALDLFAEHGVSATSLQMIANAIGLTKAAVYHQFKTKDEIIVAVTEMQLARLEAALELAEVEHDRLGARDSLLKRVIEMAVEQRHMVGLLQYDPVVVRLLGEHEPFQRFLERLNVALIGDVTSPESLVRSAMISGAIAGAVKHPLLSGLDDATLVEHLVGLVRQLVDVPATAAKNGTARRGSGRGRSPRPGGRGGAR